MTVKLLKQQHSCTKPLKRQQPRSVALGPMPWSLHRSENRGEGAAPTGPRIGPMPWSTPPSENRGEGAAPTKGNLPCFHELAILHFKCDARSHS